MALNPELLPNSMPLPFVNEILVLSRDGVEFDIDKIPGSQSGHIKAKGTIYLSNIRMVFVANKPMENFYAFDMPLLYVRGEKFNQPIFLCNNISGFVDPVVPDDQHRALYATHSFKILFKEGGCGTFVPLFLNLMSTVRQYNQHMNAQAALQVDPLQAAQTLVPSSVSTLGPMVLHKQMDNFCSTLFVRAVMLVIICFGFNSCLPDSSVNAEGGKVNVAARFIPDDCVLLQLEKWVLKSYFNKYGTLEDRIFNSFKENELTPCACEAGEDNPGNALKLSGLERRLIGEGSHRRLSTSIRMDVLDDSKDQQLMESCEVIVIDRLPAGVFADPFELQHLHELGVYGDVAVFGDTNLELPSFLSNRSAVEIHMGLGFKKASKLKRGLEINVEIPLHARYPAPGENGYSSVQFGECGVFVHYSPKLKLRSDPCLSILTASAATKPIDGRLVWEIPSGIQTHA